jgi:hypothetical protein
MGRKYSSITAAFHVTLDASMSEDTLVGGLLFRHAKGRSIKSIGNQF